MDLGFGGEVADLYHRFRRGYPPAVIERIVDAFALTRDDIAVDIGCGTGQLTLPIAARVRAAIGVDPEPDMLVRARRAAAEHGAGNVAWMLGDDGDAAVLARLFGSGVGVVLIGQALHWMKPASLLPALREIVRPGGGVAVVSNGEPLWRQDSDWSRALRTFLEDWLREPLRSDCGTGEESRRRYRHALDAAGFDVSEFHLDHTAELSFDQLLGGIYSAFPVERLPHRRTDFAEALHDAVRPHRPFVERAKVTALLGRSGF